MKRFVLIFGIGQALLAGCVSSNLTVDVPLCTAIAEFAAATPPTVRYQVELVGGRRSDPPGPEHLCKHGGTAPGEHLCGYLVPHTTWEFGKSYAEKAFMCLESGARKQALIRLSANDYLVEVTARLKTPGSSARLIRIAYEGPVNNGLYELRIGTR